MERTTLIIPAAGNGLRFVAAGHHSPKPLIRVAGAPMLQHVLNSVEYAAPWYDRVVVAVQEGFQYNAMQQFARQLHHKRNLWVVGLGPVHYGPGAAATVQAVLSGIDIARPVLVVNSDAALFLDWNHFYTRMETEQADAAVVTFDAPNPKGATEGPYSYPVLTGTRGLVRAIHEKTPVADVACAGAFWFRSAALLHYAITASEHLPTTNGERYLAPCFNVLAQQGATILAHRIENKDFIRMGVPGDLPRAERALTKRSKK